LVNISSIGGRINTHTFGEYNGNPALIELGANWLHGTNGNAVFSLAKENNLLNPYVLLERYISFTNGYITSTYVYEY
jgi:hypothetical protein